jgi:hypothetical protein
MGDVRFLDYGGRGETGIFSLDTSPLVVILPPTGGTNVIDRSYAKSICRNGFRTVILEQWTGMDEVSLDFSLHQRLFTRGTSAIQSVLEFFPRSVSRALIGTSVGALYALHYLSFSDGRPAPTIDVAFLIVGGLDLPKIVASSRQAQMVDLRRARNNKFNLPGDSAHEERIRNEFRNFSMARPASLKKLGLVISLNDDYVPTETQTLLVKSWNPDYLFKSTLGHQLTIVRFWLTHQNNISRFLNWAHSAP